VIANSRGAGSHDSLQWLQMVASSYRVLIEQDGANVPFLCRSQPVAVILLSACVPDGNNLEMLKQLKHQLGDDCPPIVVVGRNDAEIARQAFKNGAADYLIHDRITPEHVHNALQCAIETAQSQQALQCSQEQFQTSVENMLDCFGIFSSIRNELGQIVDFRIDYLNAAACENNQMPKARQIGQRLCELLPGHRETGLFDQYCHVVETGEPLIKESLVYEDTYGGQRLARAFDIRAAKLNDGFVASWRNITDRKQMEIKLTETIAALQVSQQRYRELAEAMPQMVWTADATGGVNYWNQRWYEYTGLGAAESMGVEAVKTVHPTERDRTMSLWQRSIATGEPFEIEYRIRRWDGVYHWFICRAIPTRDPQGQITSWIGTITNIHDQKQIQEKLHQSEQRLALALSAAEAGMWQWFKSDNRTIWSDENFRLLGYEPGRVVSTYDAWLNAVHPDDRDRAQQAVNQALDNRTPLYLEYRVCLPDGSERWLADIGHLTYDEDNQPNGMIGIQINITQRKQAEKAQRVSEERYRLLFESMNEGFCVAEVIFDDDHRPIDYRLLEINSVFENQTGLKQAQGKTARELLPNLESYWFELYGNVVLTGEPVRFENYACSMNRWFDVSAFRIGPPESRKVAILFKDISDRKQSEMALRQSEDRLRMALESAQIGTWDWNLLTNELTWDAGCKAMFSLPAGVEPSIEAFFEALHPDDWDRLEQAIQYSCSPDSGGNYDVEYRVIGIEDKVERWIAAKGQAYFDASGTPQRFIGTVLDITEKKQVEAQREQLLQQAQAAREAAERANRIKDEFLAVLSHELRSPLNPILGWTKLLQTRKLDETKMALAIATIERNAKLQTQLIDDLLDVAKILRGKLSLTTTAVQLSAIVEAAIDTVQTAAVAKSITLSAFLPDIGQVVGDAARLQQIVWNLLSNAIKFTPEGGRVEIRLEQVRANCTWATRNASESASMTPCSLPMTDYARLTITDTGKGISPAFLPHIFESFRQEDASTTRKYGGLGLGLAIVRQLVEAHGGAITADSPGEGLGATFTVWLPLLNAEPHLQRLDNLPQPDLDLTGIRILAVDDSSDARELLTGLFTQYGADVLSVASAADVLANLDSFQPDVLISDIGMPDVDGYALIQQIRTLPAEKGGQLPAIALTAYAREEDQQQALHSGYQRHITKPLQPELLIEAVIDLVRR
jgi:PAS domain S-box-containing protein